MRSLLSMDVLEGVGASSTDETWVEDQQVHLGSLRDSGLI